jgi:hypothetical protein
MISLKQPDGPFTIELVPGLTVTCRPRSQFDYVVAQSAATRRLERLETSQNDVFEAGILPANRMIDLQDEDQRAGLFKVLLIDELAVSHITAWAGIEATEDGTPCGPTPEGIRKLMSLCLPGILLPLGEIFFQRFTQGIRELDAAKKDSGAGATITSSAAPPTATPAAPMTSPVPAASAA